jgi:hypothetical protein
MTWGDAAALVTAAAAIAAVAGGYVQFVLKPSFLPSAEFDVDFVPLLRDRDCLYGEIAVVITNVGSNTLVVQNVRCIVRYSTDEPAVGTRPRLSEPQFAKLPTPQGEEAFVEHVAQPERAAVPGSAPSISHPGASNVTIAKDTAVSEAPRRRVWLLLVRSRTFIQPGVTQRYRKPLTLHPRTRLVDVVAAFDYRFKLRRTRRFLVKLSDPAVEELDWTLGISNHTVRHTIYVPPLVPHDSSTARTSAESDG